MYVYMSVCPLAYLKNDMSKFLYLLPVAVSHSSSVNIMYFGFVDDVMFSHNGAYMMAQRHWSSTSDPPPSA